MNERLLINDYNKFFLFKNAPLLLLPDGVEVFLVSLVSVTGVDAASRRAASGFAASPFDNDP